MSQDVGRRENEATLELQTGDVDLVPQKSRGRVQAFITEAP